MSGSTYIAVVINHVCERIVVTQSTCSMQCVRKQKYDTQAIYDNEEPIK